MANVFAAGDAAWAMMDDRHVAVMSCQLGPWSAVYTEGWDRHVVTKGAAAKQTKQLINCQRIYPPSTCNRQEILAAAAPGVQQPPRT